MSAVDFVAGCLGGCAGLIVGHPFDTIKVHMQTQDPKNPKYRGAFHCLKSLMAKESFRGLYRGMSSPMVGVSAINAIVFGVYGNVQRVSSNPDSYMSHFLAGSVAGFAQSIICSPMELAKTQLQLQTHKLGAAKFNGPTQCLSYVYQCEGVRGMFRGLGCTAARDVPGFASYFVSYEFLMRLKNEPGILYTLFAGGTAGAFSWMFTIPIDVVKSRLQADGMSGERKMYDGMVDCFRKSYQTEGSAFLTRGLSSTLLRAFPMNAVCFLVVSETLKYWQNHNTHSTKTTVKQTKQINAAHDHWDWEHKRRIMQGFLHFGAAFSDAICTSEIMEVAHDWYDNNKIYFSNNQISFNTNYEKYLES
ncbi:mitochondrial basic amino acids transporter [Sitodiplosis mosellana]|uniref:mitochondrial basic amino acids transporter n=1 Tax=Sitodiplosis mosellana TaxID=263140 RepID=UPI002443A88B|nr:mitochondrial basic amino acids transporter [Sitodiplosis mosellana]